MGDPRETVTQGGKEGTGEVAMGRWPACPRAASLSSLLPCPALIPQCVQGTGGGGLWGPKRSGSCRWGFSQNPVRPSGRACRMH